MKKTVLFLTLLWSGFHWGISQQQASAYFQQQTEYHIDVRLDDSLNILDGRLRLLYTNRSPDVLDKIGFHLWPNAYASKKTAFAKQKLQARSTKFHEADEQDMGYIQKLRFRVDERDAAFISDQKNPDMGWLILPQALKPGQTITIITPFYVKIPASFSRLCRVDQSYQITQWYPKPAVYDHKGWHLMPYLDQGEFYSEFGDFYVNIDIPEDYIVGATGELQTESEIAFIENRVERTKKMLDENTQDSIVPMNSRSRKIIQFTATQVHDFAWFANKKFWVQKKTQELASGRQVICWSMFTNTKLWKNSVDFVARAVRFYSDHVGEYPYPQATAIDGALAAGGGMEYPMITVVSSGGSEESLDEVITHEVGHNWFYGILASNERDHPFMDESINTYYEKRYTELHYPAQIRFDLSALNRFIPNFDSEEFTYLIMARNYLDQHPNQHSANFMFLNYGLDVYERAPKLIKFLEEYLGTAEFDRIMKSYYELWKFKHPYPEDLSAHFKSQTDKNLDWFFDQLISGDRKIDYAICSIKKNSGEYQLKIKSKNGVSSPLYISAMKSDSIIKKFSYDGFSGSRNIRIEDRAYDMFRIDASHETFELYRNDNTIRTRGVLRKSEPIQFKLIPSYDDPYRTEIGITPVVGWNQYNGFMLGAYFSQPWLPPRKFRLGILPFFGFKNQDWAGSAHTHYNWFFTESFIRQLKVGANARRYAYRSLEIFSDPLNYQQLNSFVELRFRTNPANLTDSRLRYSAIWIDDEKPVFDSLVELPVIDRQSSLIHELKYNYNDPHILLPRSIEILAQFQEYKVQSEQQRYLRIDAEYLQKIRYAPRRYFECRIASSFFPVNTARNRQYYDARFDGNIVRGSAGASFQGYHDYTNEHLFPGRSEISGLWAQQIMIRQGGLKIAHNATQRNNLGNTNKFLGAINLSTDLPIPRIGSMIRPYFDVAYVDQHTDANWLASGGINLRFLDKMFNVYFPLYHSKAIQDQYRLGDQASYWKQIVFSLNFKLNGMADITKYLQFN